MCAQFLFNSYAPPFGVSVHLLLLQDGLIHKDEFAFALFKAQGRSSIFVDKVFQCFDTKQTDTIDFEEFVQALSVFHPKAGLEEKAKCKHESQSSFYISSLSFDIFLTSTSQHNYSLLKDTVLGNSNSCFYVCKSSNSNTHKACIKT